jgi:hypothetical protein
MGSGNQEENGLVAGRLEAFGHEKLGNFSLRADEFDFDGGQALVAEAEGGGGSPGKVDDTGLRHGAAIVDSNDDRFMIPEVRDSEHGAERQGAMGAGELVFVVRLAAGGGAALKELAVPGSNAELVPVMVADDDLGVKVGDRRSGLSAGNAQNGGEKCAGKPKRVTRSDFI